MSNELPAKVTRTGVRQLTVCMSDDLARRLELYRRSHGLRSWGATIRHLLYLAGDGNEPRHSDAVDPAAPRTVNGPTRDPESHAPKAEQP